jgi:hypothetical protein
MNLIGCRNDMMIQYNMAVSLTLMWLHISHVCFKSSLSWRLFWGKCWSWGRCQFWSLFQFWGWHRFWGQNPDIARYWDTARLFKVSDYSYHQLLLESVSLLDQWHTFWLSSDLAECRTHFHGTLMLLPACMRALSLLHHYFELPADSYHPE